MKRGMAAAKDRLVRVAMQWESAYVNRLLYKGAETMHIMNVRLQRACASFSRLAARGRKAK